MKIKILARMAMVAAAFTLVTGCSSDHDKDTPDSPDGNTPTAQREWSDTNSRPDWYVDWSADVARPQWTPPDPRKYDSWMLLMVRVQDELLPYVSKDDLMTITIAGTTRVVASPAQNATQKPGEQANKYFLLKILGNEDVDDVIDYTLSYYNARLKQLFEVTGQDHFIAENVYGVEEDYCVDFIASCKKYPVKSTLNIILPDDIIPVAGDLVAVFVGNDCRGVQTIDSADGNKAVNLTAYGREEGEQATIAYYSQARGTTTFDTTVKLSASSSVVTLK